MGKRLVNFPELIQVKVTAEMKQRIVAEAVQHDLPEAHLTRLVLEAGLAVVRKRMQREKRTTLAGGK